MSRHSQLRNSRNILHSGGTILTVYSSDARRDLRVVGYYFSCPVFPTQHAGRQFAYSVDFYATVLPGRRRKVIHRKIDGLRRDGVRKVSLTSRANTASLMHPLNSAFELLNRLMALPRVRLRCTRKTSLAWQANLAICCRWLRCTCASSYLYINRWRKRTREARDIEGR